MHWLAARLRRLMRAGARGAAARRTPAAVLVPLVERRRGIDGVADAARRHAQGSCRPDQFPRRPHRAGGCRCLARGAARGPRGNRLSANWWNSPATCPITCGHRISRDAGGRFRQPDYQLRIAAAEVHDVFEVPLDFILDAANHKAQRKQWASDHRGVTTFPTASAISGARPPAC
jgi:hypothetical protein